MALLMPSEDAVEVCCRRLGLRFRANRVCGAYRAKREIGFRRLIWSLGFSVQLRVLLGFGVCVGLGFNSSEV